MKTTLKNYGCIVTSLLLTFAVVKAESTVNNTIKCYHCNIPGTLNPNALCPEEDLVTCPNHVAADRCFTRVTRNDTGHYHIERKCALAPCDLPDAQSSSLFKLSSKCDRSTSSYSCYSCCTGDGCNRNDGTNTFMNFYVTLPMVVLTTMMAMDGYGFIK